MRYLFSFVGPASAAVSLYVGGLWAWLTTAVVFWMVPLLDALLGRGKRNLSRLEESEAKKKRWFDVLLYMHLPIQVALFSYFGWQWTHTQEPWWVRLGWMVSVALSAGGLGITVAHELIHRPSWNDQWVGKFLLMTVQYMHFSIEHVRGHHARVATEEDPASAKRGQTFYAYWVPSVIRQYVSAWRLERRRLKKSGRPFFSLYNEMIVFGLLQSAFATSLAIAFGVEFLPAYLATALMAFSLLEVTNYIEHYGLRREKLPDGRYEPVNETHSWNSDHLASRSLLFELTRHADHHAHASRPYPILRSVEKGPQLPTGYPGMIAMALFPPLYFRVMHKRLPPEAH